MLKSVLSYAIYFAYTLKVHKKLYICMISEYVSCFNVNNTIDVFDILQEISYKSKILELPVKKCELVSNVWYASKVRSPSWAARVMKALAQQLLLTFVPTQQKLIWKLLVIKICILIINPPFDLYCVFKLLLCNYLCTICCKRCCAGFWVECLSEI